MLPVKSFPMHLLHAAFLLLVLTAGACRTYEVVSVQSVDWPARSSEVNIGYFDASGSASRAANRNNLYESLSFSLREANFRTREAPDLFTVLSRNELPVNRLLTEAEVLRLSGLVPGRLLLQGRLEEVLTQTLVEDRVQVQVNVNIYSLETGRRLGEIRVYGKDLENVTGSETLAISRLIAKRLREMTGKETAIGKPAAAPEAAAHAPALASGAELDAEEEIQREMRARYAQKRAIAEAQMTSRSGMPQIEEGGESQAAVFSPAHARVSIKSFCFYKQADDAVQTGTSQVIGSSLSVHYYSIRNGYAGDYNA